MIWAQGRNMSSAYDVRRVVAALQWPADPISLHLASPDLPAPVLHDPDPMRIVRREGGTITPDGGPLTTAAYDRARQWRQQWLALFEPALAEPALPAVIGPDGDGAGRATPPNGLRCSWPWICGCPGLADPLPQKVRMSSVENVPSGSTRWLGSPPSSWRAARAGHHPAPPGRG